MNPSDNTKNEAYNGLVEAVRERTTARRLEIKSNQFSPSDIDIVRNYFGNEHCEQELVGSYKEVNFKEGY